jgi:hypothetical protein
VGLAGDVVLVVGAGVFLSMDFGLRGYGSRIGCGAGSKYSEEVVEGGEDVVGRRFGEGRRGSLGRRAWLTVRGSGFKTNSWSTQTPALFSLDMLMCGFEAFRVLRAAFISISRPNLRFVPRLDIGRMFAAFITRVLV